ncbi:DEAD/DEAH box helicase domain protein [Methylocella silvestris BL2]|uniref:Probable DNA 3'-5' helicase RecG n=1 Tax=Methylocella silvestris (strain DSM 15510 / CIP 108128 / LMG 27833 / NCIMB 13906 / BL2) TaxID=395965 RepID=B8ET13_METSB|nr:ATP-dependent DNA helicase RecG [Methylocella silvestris]ACK51151.1 DEAD/DEAH box helicase domain protein [Methylocella silvestris BL2]
MRPSILNPLFASAASLPGVGPKTGKLLDRLFGVGEARVLDLLFHLPAGVVDRRTRAKIAEAPLDAIVVIEVMVVEHRPARGKGPTRVLVEDETGDILLVFFLTNHNWIERSLPVGAKRWVSGKLEIWDGHRQMVHPDRVLDAEGLAKMAPVEPVYPLTDGLSQRLLAKAVDGALARLPALPDWGGMPAQLNFVQALAAAHRPQTPEDILPEAAARKKLASDEMLAGQLALGLMRARERRMPGRASAGDGRIAQKIRAALPFSLTRGQEQALAEIRADLSSESRMLRLLQGDVGSGKTLVALLAMASCVEAGRQAALMAPTEILARQHFASLQRFAEPGGLRLALLTGRDKGVSRDKTLRALASGEIDILIGTHALFQQGVDFRDLALAVVDEQHRFGVRQRLALGDKGERTDILAMTATPIPRSLVLTYFGDMEISTIREKPVGRQPIETRALPTERLGELIERLSAALAAGAQAYWVCPLVEESEALDVAAAQERFEDLQKFFGPAVGLIHGKMKGKDKDAAMEAFLAGTTKILVATTVIEVGVDAPQASIIVIEHAERFGLAQLHQLRGRVGRGSAKSACILLYKGPLGETAKARIEILRESEDGFRIAEEDLRLRGEGEVLGQKQSGLPGFRLADPAAHADLLVEARREAQRIVAENPKLEGEKGEALRLLLNIFERAEAIRLLGAG